MPERAAIIDCGLSALCAPMPVQWLAAILAMHWRWSLRFSAAKEMAAARWRLFNRRDRRIAQNELCHFIGHGASLRKPGALVYSECHSQARKSPRRSGSVSPRRPDKMSVLRKSIDHAEGVMTRSPPNVASQLLQTKSPDRLMAEAAAPGRQLKRALSAFDLTCVGIGAIIGAGIFALAGTAAAGEQIEASIWKTPVLNFIISYLTHVDLVFGRPGAGPAVMLSFVVAAVACGFAALCYAELASMIPVSGSAYTYSYATLGEIIAWVIGWDLILEYEVGNVAVAVGWSGYFVKLCGSLFGLKFPLWLVSDYRTASDLLSKRGDTLQDFSSTPRPTIAGA